MKTEMSRSDDILTVAETLFRTKGYQATSMSDVAELCRLQKASLYYHFENKEQLALTVMAKVKARMDTAVFSYAFDDGLSCDDRLRKMNNAIADFFSVKNGGCLFANFAIEQIDRTPSFVIPIRHYFDEWANAYVSIFSGAYSVDQAKSLAKDFVSDLQGALILMRVTGDSGQLQRSFARSLQALHTGLARGGKGPDKIFQGPIPKKVQNK